MNNNTCEGLDKPKSEFEDIECCCCGDSTIADLSKVKNPELSKKEASVEFLNSLKKKGEDLNVVQIAFTKLPEKVLNNNPKLKYKNAIVMTFPIAIDLIKSEPGTGAKSINDHIYEEFGEITYKMSDLLREKGFKTQVLHPYEKSVDLIELAQKAGLGCIGKNRLLITPELGPRQKISAILTSIENLPFSQANEHLWIKEYCKNCGKCIKKCLNKALIDSEPLKKAEININDCTGCSEGCTYCISSCPFYTKGYSWVKEKQEKIESKTSK